VRAGQLRLKTFSGRVQKIIGDQRSGEKMPHQFWASRFATELFHSSEPPVHRYGFTGSNSDSVYPWYLTALLHLPHKRDKMA
jgi:hypothetical protein